VKVKGGRGKREGGGEGASYFVEKKKGKRGARAVDEGDSGEGEKKREKGTAHQGGKREKNAPNIAKRGEDILGKWRRVYLVLGKEKGPSSWDFRGGKKGEKKPFRGKRKGRKTDYLTADGREGKRVVFFTQKSEWRRRGGERGKKQPLGGEGKRNRLPFQREGTKTGGTGVFLGGKKRKKKSYPLSRKGTIGGGRKKKKGKERRNNALAGRKGEEAFPFFGPTAGRETEKEERKMPFKQGKRRGREKTRR